MRSAPAARPGRLPSVRGVRQSSRRSDDADVIRARLRALLDDGSRGGWVPEDDAAPATQYELGARTDDVDEEPD